MAAIVTRIFLVSTRAPFFRFLSLFLGSANWEAGAEGNQCTVWHGLSHIVVAPGLKFHRRKHTCICVSRREIKSWMSLLGRQHFKIWEHSWIPKVNYTISQMFQEQLLHFFFLLPEGKLFVHKENNEQKLLSQNCSWLFKMSPFENNQRCAQWFIEEVVHFSVIYHM